MHDPARIDPSVRGVLSRRCSRLFFSLTTLRRKKEKLRGGWVQSANFASECARKLLILWRREIGNSPRPERYAYFAPESS